MYKNFHETRTFCLQLQTGLKGPQTLIGKKLEFPEWKSMCLHKEMKYLACQGPEDSVPCYFFWDYL